MGDVPGCRGSDVGVGRRGHGPVARAAGAAGAVLPGRRDKDSGGLVKPRLLDLGNGGTAFIDAEDADLVAGYGWYQTANGYVGAMTTDRTGKRKLLLLHRLLMGEPEG